MTDADKKDIIDKAEALNPATAKFQAKQDADGRMGFDRV